jgi:hypothetical protein
VRLCFALLVLSLPSYAFAQAPVWASGWWLSVGADGMRFGSVATSIPAPQEPEASLRPSGRTGLHAAVARGFGAWRAQFELGWALGEAEAGTEMVAVRDKTLDLSRYRLATGVERRLAGIGGGELAIALSPTLDLWRAAGDNHARLGAEARVALRLPLGGLALENRLSAGLSGSPLDAQDLGPGFETSSLEWLAFGVALWLPL